MGKKIYIKLMLLCMLLGMAGCGEEETPADLPVNSAVNPFAESQETEISSEPDVEIDRSGFDWREGGWKWSSPKGQGETLYVSGYTDELSGEVDFEYETRQNIDIKSYGSFICKLEVLTTGDAVPRYFLNRYDGDTGESTYVELDMDSLLGGEERAEIREFDIRNGEEYVFFRATYEEGYNFSLDGSYDLENEDLLCGLKAVHTDLEGNVQKTVDLFPGMLESQFATHKGWKALRILQVDEQGNYYMVGLENAARMVLVLNAEGKEACIMEPYPAGTVEEGDWGNERIVSYVKSPDGIPIFYLAHRARSETSLFTYDQQKNEQKQLMLLPQYYLFDMKPYITEEGICYYAAGDGKLYRWDLYTGSCVKLMNYAVEDITTSTGWLCLALTSQGQLMICETEDDGFASIYLLDKEEPSPGEALKIVSLTSNCSRLQAVTADYSRKHREDSIVVEYGQEDGEAYRNRIMADLTAGSGPSVMYVSREDMVTLYEKRLFDDLTDLLDPKIVDEIFPGILDCGKIEGKQIGFALNAQLRTMMVNRDIWDGDNWKLEDVMALLDQEEIRTDLRALVATAVGPYGGSGIFEHLVLQDLSHSPFLDLEQGTCYFDTEEFIKILELCKQYGAMVVTEEDAAAMMHEGRALAYVADIRDANTFCHRMSELGDNFYCVGYPTEGDCGSYWDCEYFLVMRKGADCRDTVKGLMELLYSLRQQRKENNPLNRRVYVDMNYRDPSHPDYTYIYGGQGRYMAMKAKADGSSQVGDFVALADRSVPYYHCYDTIVDIVKEEAESFFSGDKDPDAVSETIQSRVRLYLAEQN